MKTFFSIILNCIFVVVLFFLVVNILEMNGIVFDKKVVWNIICSGWIVIRGLIFISKNV